MKKHVKSRNFRNERSSRDVVVLVDVAGLRAGNPVEGRDGRTTQTREGAEDRKKKH